MLYFNVAVTWTHHSARLVVGTRLIRPAATQSSTHVPFMLTVGVNATLARGSIVSSCRMFSSW